MNLRRRSTGLVAGGLGVMIAAAGLFALGARDGGGAGEAGDGQTHAHPDFVAASGESATADGVRTGSLNLYRLPEASFEELVRDRPFIAVVRVERQLEDFWPDTGGAEVLVASRFVLRVEDVISGELTAGMEIIVHTPGGTVKTEGIPATGGSVKPVPGDQTVKLEFADWPLFRVGTRELVFLAKGESDAGETRWGAVPEGRFRLSGDTLETIFPNGPPVNIVLPSDITSRIVGKSVADVKEQVDRTNPIP